MHRATNAAEIVALGLVGREVWAQPVIGHAIVGELLAVDADAETLTLRRKYVGYDQQEVETFAIGYGEPGSGGHGIEHLTWQVPMSEAKPGDRYRSLGPGFIARTVGSVETLCNCEASARRLDPQTSEPLHHDVVVVTSDSLHPERYQGQPDHLIWLTTPESF